MGVLTPRRTKAPAQIAGQRSMTTPLQAARHARGWSQYAAVRALMRLAEHKGVRLRASAASLKTELSRWENGHITPDYWQTLLCDLYRLTPGELGFSGHELPSERSGENGAGIALMNKQEWTRDDLRSLSAAFNDEISDLALSDIEMLAHEWLSAEKPQLIELNAGRHIGDSLVATIGRRVARLRRADDFMSGRTSHDLVRQELRATTGLLSDAALTDDQGRRLLATAGELAQLGAWVAADAGLHREAAKYTENGVIAANAADNAPLAANIISTLSYQISNTGNPRQAALLARTAYAGGRHDATPTAKAILLERVAWADARSGDLASCERTLGLVRENFSRAEPGDDNPDWAYWLNTEEIDIMAGRCYTELKQPVRAEPLLREAIAGYDDTHIREKALYLSWLAENYILLNEIDAASEIATQVLELKGLANSIRTDERLRHLAKLLRRYADVQSAASFLDRYKESSR